MLANASLLFPAAAAAGKADGGGDDDGGFRQYFVVIAVALLHSRLPAKDRSEKRKRVRGEGQAEAWCL